ncbi:hypothetical protein SAMN05216369_3000 [Marinobacter antarcticus]|uniref:Uncharacterized protein n=1 Tax=Marinobacter antarcticus TaxID=564117 RepID=A0A1M6UZD7_9GAMM|nr:hypothetical protein [Marinobacter antarcticus]SHK74514.1 hypothetical protein SAMN05216369_3000 [Marinobacter antarcticus]
MDPGVWLFTGFYQQVPGKKKIGADSGGKQTGESAEYAKKKEKKGPENRPSNDE